MTCALISVPELQSRFRDLLEGMLRGLQNCDLLGIRSAMGSNPLASRFRAASRRSRASASEISGYRPKAISFSEPSKRYFQRQSLLPAGATNR